MWRERELAGGIITSKMNRRAIDEPVGETESVRRPVGLGLCALPSAEWYPSGLRRSPGRRSPQNRIPRRRGKGSRSFATWSF
jgi:hypothetical protein